ncbi:polyprenyl synthetase family protein [Streptomyces sp. NPDC088847]|uniref:polyprenyl synthetase family protein n=1 Tax=Streptomyces sp. NPDC088847 TaxID=3365909 RepID=UPI00380ABA9E
MTVVDVTAAYSHIMGCERSVAEAISSAIDRLRNKQPSLAHAVQQLMDSDTTTPNIFRLLPLPILRSLGMDCRHGIPLVAASRIWWTGAEAFDDLADGQYDAESTGISAGQAAVASAACLGIIPLTVLDETRTANAIGSRWVQEFVETSLQAAEGQLNDVTPASGPISWENVMQTYAGKNGAAYARDAAMAAYVAGADRSVADGWRTFGRLFGVLRQLVNDRSAVSAQSDEDLANGTGTLLLAVAFEEARRNSDVAELTSLRIAALTDSEARIALANRFRSAPVVANYNFRIGVLHQILRNLLETLMPSCRERDLMRWMLDISKETAKLQDEDYVR